MTASMTGDDRDFCQPVREALSPGREEHRHLAHSGRHQKPPPAGLQPVDVVVAVQGVALSAATTVEGRLMVARAETYTGLMVIPICISVCRRPGQDPLELEDTAQYRQ